MTSSHIVLPLFAVVGFGTMAAAQGESIDSPMVPIHTAVADPVGGAYGIWAAGPSYKVSFHDGMTFHPLMGNRIEHTASLSWRTVSASVGSAELLDATEPAPRQISDFRYEYDHGAIVEAYDVRADGLEQTFVLARRPATAGDLVITGTLAGDLTASNRPAAHAGLVFTGPQEIARVGYGAAIAIDRNGDTMPMTTALIDGQVELRLAGQWLEGAAYPVVVDPLLTNELIGAGADIHDVDVYRDDEQSLSNVWVVYSLRASATDLDLMVRRFPDDFSGPGATVYSDLSTTWSSQHGQIAGLGGSGAGKTITVFERDFQSGARRVRWHTHAKNDATLSTNYSSVPWTSGTNEWRPDVGGTLSSVPGTVALLVYQRENGATFANTADSEIVGLKIDTAVSSNGAPVGAPFLLGATSGDQERPSVNQVAEGGVPFSWLVAFQHNNNSTTGKWNVIAQRVAASFGFNGNPRHVSSNPHHELAPSVEGANGRYLVTFGVRPDSQSKPTEIFSQRIAAQRIDWPHANVNGTLPHSETTVMDFGASAMIPGALGFDVETASHWVATFTVDYGAYKHLFVSKIGYDGSETVRRIVYNGDTDVLPMPGGVSYDGDNDRFTLAFPVENANASDTLWGNHLTYTSVTPPTEHGVGCHPTAAPRWDGSQAIGSELGGIELVQAPANTGTFLFASLAPAAISLVPYGFPPCTLAVDPTAPMFLASMFTVTNNVGRARIALPLPSFLPPGQLCFQWFTIEPGSNQVGIRATRGLRVAVNR